MYDEVEIRIYTKGYIDVKCNVSYINMINSTNSYVYTSL